MHDVKKSVNKWRDNDKERGKRTTFNVD